VGAFEIAKNIGLEGIMIDMGSEQNGLPLRKQAMLDLYRETSKSRGVKISSIAIEELNNVPYKSDLRTVQWVWDSVDVAKYLGVR
jgi:sugar phosphate isomerase/epimerase